MITTGAERLGWTLDELIEQTLEAMQAFEHEGEGLFGTTVDLKD